MDKWPIEKYQLPALQRWQVQNAVLYGREMADPVLRRAAHDLAECALRVRGWSPGERPVLGTRLPYSLAHQDLLRTARYARAKAPSSNHGRPSVFGRETVGKCFRPGDQ